MVKNNDLGMNFKHEMRFTGFIHWIDRLPSWHLYRIFKKLFALKIAPYRLTIQTQSDGKNQQ